MGSALGDLEPGEDFDLPWGTRGTFWGFDEGDADIVLDSKKGPGREAVMSRHRLVFRTGVRSPHVVGVGVA